MREIASAAGISRQALYLHFVSRTELMVATMEYVDEVQGLNKRLERLKTLPSAIDLMDAGIEIWGNYIPEIYGLAKGMMKARDTDEAVAAAWDKSMNCLRDVCRDVIDGLHAQGFLSAECSRKEAAEMFWTMLSISNWEQLTIQCGWSNAQYVDWIKMLSRRTFVDQTTIEK